MAATTGDAGSSSSAAAAADADASAGGTKKARSSAGDDDEKTEKKTAATTAATATASRRRRTIRPSPRCNETQRRLLQAAADGDLERVLQREEDLERRDGDGGDGCSAAAAVDVLLRTATCQSGCSALHWAAGCNRTGVVDFLVVEKGCDVEMPAYYRRRGWDGAGEGAGGVKNRAHQHEKPQEPGSSASGRVRGGGRKDGGRTPLHYAARNGCLDAVRCLVEEHNADPRPLGRDGVTPLQLAVWQNQVDVAKYFVRECRLDPARERNDFDCNLIHWLAIAPLDVAGEDSRDLVPTARWLASQGVDMSARQKQGHSALHKASWLGHYELVRYLHEQHDLWDDVPDHAGNYAVDLCKMTGASGPLQPRHVRIVDYLLRHCSRQRAASCAVLGLSVDAAVDCNSIRRAYLRTVRDVHPDTVARRRRGRQQQTHSNIGEDASDYKRLHDFLLVKHAYEHLMHQGGRGTQCNPAHELKLLLKASAEDEGDMEEKAESSGMPSATASATTGCQCSNGGDNNNGEYDSFFKTRLLAVLAEYGSKGLDVSNVQKKWKQVWPEVAFPPTKGRLSKWIQIRAGDVVSVRRDDNGCLRVHAKQQTSLSSI